MWVFCSSVFDLLAVHNLELAGWAASGSTPHHPVHFDPCKDRELRHHVRHQGYTQVDTLEGKDEANWLVLEKFELSASIVNFFWLENWNFSIARLQGGPLAYYNPTAHRFYCLQAETDERTKYLKLEKCDLTNEYQQWTFEHYSEEYEALSRAVFTDITNSSHDRHVLSHQKYLNSIVHLKQLTLFPQS